MKIFLAVLTGFIFFIVIFLFVIMINMHFTLLDKEFVKKNVLTEDFYQKMPKAINEMIIENKSEKASDQAMYDAVGEALTPELIKKHMNSIIDQGYDPKTKNISEDFSDFIGSAQQIATSKLGIQITIDGFQTNKTWNYDKKGNRFFSYIMYEKYFLIGFSVLLLGLLLVIFATSGDNIGSHFIGLGWIFAIETFFLLIFLLTLFIISPEKLAMLIPIDSSSSELFRNLMTSFSVAMKSKLIILTLFELGISFVVAVLFFVLGFVLKPKSVVSVPPTQPVKS